MANVKEALLHSNKEGVDIYPVTSAANVILDSNNTRLNAKLLKFSPTGSLTSTTPIDAATLGGVPAAQIQSRSCVVELPESIWVQHGGGDSDDPMDPDRGDPWWTAQVNVSWMTESWQPGVPAAIMKPAERGYTQLDQDKAMSAAVGCINRIDTENGYVLIYCLNEKPDYTNISDSTFEIRIPEVK